MKIPSSYRISSAAVSTLTGAVLTLVLVGAANAQSASSVLKHAEKALGGSNSLKKVTSVVRSGAIRRVSDGAEGKYLYKTAQPNLYSVGFDVAGFETQTGYNGRSAWTRNSRDGLQTLTGKLSVDLQAKALFANALWLNYKDQKAKVTSGGRTTIDGKAANVVSMTTQKGVAIKLFFDATSGLPARVEIPSADQTETIDFSDYRDVSGIKQPFFQKIAVGDQTFEVRLDQVKINQPVARSEFDFPVELGEPLPDIKELLREVNENQARIETILESYSFNQTITERELTKDGTLRDIESETFQLSFYKGNRIRRLIEKNGKPLSEKEQKEADKDAGKQVEEIEKKLAKEEQRVSKIAEKGAKAEDNRRISILELLQASKLTNPRRERFRGRDVVVFDFEPNPAYDMKNASTMLRFFGKTAGVMWIDAKDKQVARIEALLYDSFKIGGGILAKLNKGASFTMEQDRINDEVWLPSQTEINGSVRVLLVKGMNINQLVRSYGYRKFETEVKDAKVNEVKTP